MKKEIDRQTFNKTLKSIRSISPQERGYLNRVFRKGLKDGLDSLEVKKEVNKLRFNKGDELDQWELQKVKKTLLDKIEE